MIRSSSLQTAMGQPSLRSSGNVCGKEPDFDPCQTVPLSRCPTVPRVEYSDNSIQSFPADFPIFKELFSPKRVKTSRSNGCCIYYTLLHRMSTKNEPLSDYLPFAGTGSRIRGESCSFIASAYFLAPAGFGWPTPATSQNRSG